MPDRISFETVQKMKALLATIPGRLIAFFNRRIAKHKPQKHKGRSGRGNLPGFD
jgi:hypothetical protein